MWLVRQSHACSSAWFLPVLRTDQYGLQRRVLVYTTLGCIRRNMSHDAYVEYSTESVRCRGTETYSYGMARHGTRVCQKCSLSRKRPAREVELTGRGCFFDGCHIKHSVREAVPARKYYLEMWTKKMEHKRGKRKLQNAMIWYVVCYFEQYWVLCLR